MKQVAGEIEENGVSGVKKILLKKMNKWKSEKIKIGIIGDSLSGKVRKKTNKYLRIIAIYFSHINNF